MGVFKGFRKDRLPAALDYYKGQGLRLTGSGEWRSARCPFHDDRNASFGIHVKTGRFRCHGCSIGGDIVDFHRKCHGGTFKEAAKALGAWEEPSAPVARPETAKQAARRLATKLVGKDFIPEALHEYRDERGVLLYGVIRARDPKTGKKWIRPLRNVGGQFMLGKPEFPHGAKPLYGLALLTRNPGEVVLVCEGEWCADKLRKVGLLAITSGGASSAAGADWSALAGRKVIIWPDHDEPGVRYAEDVVHLLTDVGCSTEVIDTTQLGLSEGGDAVDWLRAHPEATKEDIFALPRQGTPKAEAVVATASAATLEDARLEIVARWCAERCVRDHRAWGGVNPLYRDLCSWCEPDYAIATTEFVGLLADMGIQVDGDYAKGLLLAQDFDATTGPCA